jgi:hypothetical protein
VKYKLRFAGFINIHKLSCLKEDRLTEFKSNGTTCTGIIRTRVGFPGSFLLNDEDISKVFVVLERVGRQREFLSAFVRFFSVEN